MSADLKRRNVPFSPPDMTEAEASEVTSEEIVSRIINKVEVP